MRLRKGSWLWIPALAPLGRNDRVLAKLPRPGERRIVRAGVSAFTLNGAENSSNSRLAGPVDGRPVRLAKPKRRLLERRRLHGFDELFSFPNTRDRAAGRRVNAGPRGAAVQTGARVQGGPVLTNSA